MIKGISKLTELQLQHMEKVHAAHVACNGAERQKHMQIREVWIDSTNCVCVRLANGEWYHYYSDCTWA